MGEEDRQKDIDRAAAAGIIAGIVLAPFTFGASLLGSLGTAIAAGVASEENENSDD